MASQGGGKMKGRGEHSPAKPYDQRKSFFERITDSIKDVLRPSWLTADIADDASSPPRTGKTLAVHARFQQEDDSKNEEPRSEHPVGSSESHVSPLLPPDSSVNPVNTSSLRPMPSGSPAGLWSVAAGDSPGLHQQNPALSPDGPGQVAVGRSSAVASSGSQRHMTNSFHAQSVECGEVFHPSRGLGGLPWTEDSRLSRMWASPSHRLVSSQGHTSQSSTSLVRQRQPRQRSVQVNSSFSGKAVSESSNVDSPFKRQRLWTPEMSRKGRPLQPPVHDQPAFKMSVFCSSSLSSASARRSVTPKPVKKSGNAVLSSSTTQIYKTLERLSDVKRARVSHGNRESLMSFTPPSWKKPRPLQRNVQSHSMEPQSCAETSSSKRQERVFSPAAVSESPALTAPQTVEDEVIIADESSDDEDVQIIEPPEEASGKDNDAGSCDSLTVTSRTSQPKETSSAEKCQQQLGREKEKGSVLNKPAEVAHGCYLTKTSSPVTGGFGSSSPAFVTPPAWGSTAPKPKSIMAGNFKPAVSSHKSVSFNDNRSGESGGPKVAPTHLKAGSVMDVLGGSPTTAISSPAASVGEGLSAQVRGPAGSWECEVCMLHNIPDLTHCLACQASKPGSGASPPALCSSKPVCVAGGTTGGRGFSFSSSTPSTTVSPFLASPPANKGCFGGVRLDSCHSTAADTPSGAGGFKFGTSSSTCSSSLVSGGFPQGTPSSDTVSSASPAGFTAGKMNTAASSQAPKASGFQFGGTGFSVPSNAQCSSLTTVTSSKSGSTSTAGGFRFGVPAASCVSGKSTVCQFGSPVVTHSETSKSGGSVFRVPAQCEGQKPNAGSDVGKLTPAETSQTSHAQSSSAGTCTGASPLSGASRTCDSVSPALPTKATSTLTTGCFQFSGTANGERSSPFTFGSHTSTKVTLQSSDSCVKQNKDLKTSPSNSVFSFGGTSKSGQSKLPSAQTGQNGPNLFAPVCSSSKGFVFGAPSASPAKSSPLVPGGVHQPGKGSELSSSAAKSALNGEAGAVQRGSFGEGSVADSSATVGFSFAAPYVQCRKTVSGQDLFGQAMQPPLLGDKSGSEGTSGGKHHSDNDVGTDDVKTESLTGSKVPGFDGAEPFKFASPATVNSSCTSFKLGQISGPARKTSDPSGNQASEVPSTQRGFSFSTQTNAASSKDLRPSQVSMFGAGSGSTGTGQFSFSVGAGSRSNAAAASPFASDVSTPAKDFSFSGATQPSFTFGAGGSSNSSAPVFQFSSPQSVDSSPTQNASGAFTFGQTAPGSKSSDSDPTPAAPTAVGFGAAPAHDSFNIGTGDGPRKLRRAVRRVPRH